MTQGAFVVGPGSLLPAWQKKGWIVGEWGELENGRRAKFYALTAAGRAQLLSEKKTWRKVYTAVNLDARPNMWYLPHPSAVGQYTI